MSADLGAVPEGERYGLVPAFALTDPSVKPGPKALYASLCTNADSHGHAWRSFRRLAAEFGVSKRQIQRWLGDLERAGLVMRIGWQGKSPRLLIIRGPAGRPYAREVNARNYVKRAVEASVDRDKAARTRTQKSQDADKGVAATATPVSPKHDLLYRANPTDEEARQNGERPMYPSRTRRPWGLRCVQNNQDGVHQALNGVAAQIEGGWETVAALTPEQLLPLLNLQPGGPFTLSQVSAALAVPAAR